jgi:7-keto-8-aminopelargonate synthetase-like enzyme
MIFSGPIQPPMLGAAVASARLHLTDEFVRLQAELDQRIDVALAAIARTGLNVVDLSRTPIFHVQTDSPRVAFSACTLLRERGYYCSPCTFPAVPMNRPGLRFTLSRHNEPSDIEPFVSALGECVAEALDRTVSMPLPADAAAQ